jgi:O-antigen biosynthesis protein
LAEIVSQIDVDRRRAIRNSAELERRLAAIENSRFLRTLQLPERLFGDWKGRLGQLLLHSRLHPLYLKLVNPRFATDRYQLWIDSERPPVARRLARQPLISLVLPVHNPRRDWLEAAVESVLGQTYGCWQLCVASDDCSQDWVADYFAACSSADCRVRFVSCHERLGIAGTSNEAAHLALYCVAEALEQQQADLIYSDEDYLDSHGRRVRPIFKPAFSPDLLRCGMYFGHLLVVRTKRLDEAGWFRTGFDGSQDYDLALRLTEKSAAVVHIPQVLYHWRQHAGSTALHGAAKPYTQAAGLKALAEVMYRQDKQAAVEPGALPNSYRVRWPVPAGLKASLVICSRNPRLLKRCLHVIERTTLYPHREIVVVEHRVGNSAAMDRLLSRHICTRVPYAGPFHFAVMNNLGARQASGDVLVFLNDDIVPLNPAWLGEMLAHANRSEIGAVGARLLYRSGAIQHAGMVIGIMAGVGHLHRNTFGSQFWNWLPFTRNVSAVTGACLAIRKSVFEELGGFDENFPVNYNDVDLCLRARQAGYRVVMEPAAVLRHYECQTRQPGIRLEELYRFEQRWAAWLERGDPYYSPYLSRTREDANLELQYPVEPAGWR